MTDDRADSAIASTDLAAEESAYGGAVPRAAEGPEWRIPAPLGGMPAVPVFIWDLLPSSIRPYVEDVSTRQGSPAEFVAVSIITAFASVVGNGARIAPKANDTWTVVPTMWSMLVGEASMMKTPAMQAGLMPLDDLQSSLDQEYQDRRDAQNAEVEFARLLNQELSAKARLALREQNPQEAYRLVAMRPKLLYSPQALLQVGNITETRLVQLLVENPYGLLAVHDELPALFSRLLQRSGASERAALLKGANGDLRHIHDRAGRERLTIPQLTLSILGGIQPSRLSSIVKDANAEGADGLLARFQLTVWPDPVAYRRGVDRAPDEHAAEAARQIFRDAYAFARGGSGPKVLRFASDAQARFDAWSAGNLAMAATKESALQSHLVKTVKTIASLALLMELMNGGRAEVTACSIETALRWAPFLAGHAERIYSVGTSGSAAQRILDRRRDLPTCFTARDVYRSNWTGLGKGAAENGLADLLKQGHLRAETRGTGGRPTTVYTWNPPALSGNS